MASRLGWVDQDDRQRAAMLKVVELFKDEGTVDELGVGSIRDTLADALFPGTSVLLTRARYLLLIPWLIQQVTASSSTSAEGIARLRVLEGRLIHSLLKADDQDGLIGRQAKEKLKRMPSSAYWAALGHFGIRSPNLSIEGLLRAEISSRLAAERAAAPDDPGAERDSFRGSLHADLPAAPEGLLTATTLTLSSSEADFLRDQLEKSTQGTLFAWLLERRMPSSVGYVWDHEAAGEFPDEAAQIVDVGRRFHTLVHGAALTYNSMLARQRGDPDLIASYDDQIDGWAQELSDDEPLVGGWTTQSLWALTAGLGQSVPLPTRTFVDSWVRAVTEHGADAAKKPFVHDLIRQREIVLKGGRARVVNRDALNAWTGAAGLVRLDYRWAVAQRLMDDILNPVDEVA